MAHRHAFWARQWLSSKIFWHFGTSYDTFLGCRKLPEELLAALSKFLIIGKDATEQGDINKETMEQIRLIGTQSVLLYKWICYSLIDR